MQRDLLDSAINVSAINVSRAIIPSIPTQHLPSLKNTSLLFTLQPSAMRSRSMEESLANSSCRASLFKLCLEISAHEAEAGSVTASCLQR